ncbi:MAG: hypothetical protein RLZZ59_117, partial [Pseudomonadota bacterium]
LISSVPSTKKPLVFLDSLDPFYVTQTLAKITPNQTAFIIISKSGNTHETNTLLEYLIHNKYLEYNNLFVLSSKENSVTYNMTRGIPYGWINYPETVSGRFSLLEVPFLTIAGALGVNPKFFIEKNDKKLEDSIEFMVNRWLKNYNEGRKIWVIINYNKQLEGLFLWIRQIVGESLGKNGFGITPIIAEGSMDEHSQLQLFLDGPNDKFYDIISSEYTDANYALAIAQNDHATMTAKMLNDKGRDVVHSHHDSVSEELIARYIELYKGLVIKIAENIGLNPFSQPAVENIKQKSNEV